MFKSLILAALLAAAPLAAQSMQGMDPSKTNPGKMDHSKMDHGKKPDDQKMGCMGEDGQCKMMASKMMAAGKNTPANPYAEASMASHKAMMTAMGGDASETWTRQMIEHHRGGIAMSKIALDKAQDKDTLANARKLIAAQDREIGVYQAWLKSRGKTAQ